MMDKCAPGSLDEIVSDEGAIGLLAFGESDNYDNAVVIQGQGSARCATFNNISKHSFCQKDDYENEFEISHDRYETHQGSRYRRLRSLRAAL